MDFFSQDILTNRIGKKKTVVTEVAVDTRYKAKSYTLTFPLFIYQNLAIRPETVSSTHLDINITGKVRSVPCFFFFITSFKLNNILAAFEVLVQRIPQFHSIY